MFTVTVIAMLMTGALWVDCLPVHPEDERLIREFVATFESHDPTNWATTSDVCAFTGIICRDEGEYRRIDKVWFHYKNIVATLNSSLIPRSITSLSLGFNQFYGTVDFQNLPTGGDKFIGLEWNSFSGQPSFLGSGPFNTISGNNNKFSGTLDLTNFPILTQPYCIFNDNEFEDILLDHPTPNLMSVVFDRNNMRRTPNLTAYLAAPMDPVSISIYKYTSRGLSMQNSGLRQIFDLSTVSPYAVYVGLYAPDNDFCGETQLLENCENYPESLLQERFSYNCSCTGLKTFSCQNACFPTVAPTLEPTNQPTPVPTIEPPTPLPTQVPTLPPTPVPASPTPDPTLSPTPVPTSDQVTAYPRCDLGNVVNLAVSPYNNTGLGAQFVIPRDMFLSGFAFSYAGGGGMRCHNAPFAKPVYMGCHYPTVSGFAEMIVQGTARSDPVLIPTTADPNVVPISYTSVANTNILLYNLTNCPYSPLQATSRSSLSVPTLFLAGTTLSLWHSESFYQIGVSDNSGLSKIGISGNLIPTPRPTRVPTRTPTQAPTPQPTPRPSRVPTLIPTRIPSAVPSTPIPTSATSSPTYEPTVSPPGPGVLACDLAGAFSLTPTVGSQLRYNNTVGPVSVKVPKDMTIRGFAVEFKGGPGIRCSNAPFTPPSYLGCGRRANENIPRGYAEIITVGTTQERSSILWPDINNADLNVQSLVPGGESSDVHLYAVRNCPFPTHLSILMRGMLSAPRFLAKNTVLSLWHSEVFYNFSVSDNSGYSSVYIYVFPA